MVCRKHLSRSHHNEKDQVTIKTLSYPRASKSHHLLVLYLSLLCLFFHHIFSVYFSIWFRIHEKHRTHKAFLFVAGNSISTPLCRQDSCCQFALCSISIPSFLDIFSMSALISSSTSIIFCISTDMSK